MTPKMLENIQLLPPDATLAETLFWPLGVILIDAFETITDDSTTGYCSVT